MIIDHVGLFFFPNLLVMRLIGRISFPLFGWLLANGADHTRSIKKYLLRLLLLAIISQIPFLLANRFVDPRFSDLNIVFTLALALSAIAVIKYNNNKIIWIAAGTLAALAATLLKTDYGAFGVISIIGFYIFLKNKLFLVIAQIIIFLVPYILLLLNNSTSIELIGLLSLPLIIFYNGKQGPKVKYLFYIFYPLQYIIIYIIQTSFLKF